MSQKQTDGQLRSYQEGKRKPANQFITGRCKNLSQDTKDKIRKWALENPKGNGSTPEIEAERRRKISSRMKAIGAGGLNPGSGRGKKGWYKGIFCDSSWELAFVIHCLDHRKSIRRSTDRLPYVYKDKNCLYFPDFVVDGETYEIKGYETDRWKAKIADFPHIRVIGKREIEPILNYVSSKYGKNFTSLYGQEPI